MKRSIGTRLILLKNDIAFYFNAHKKNIAFSFVILILGVGFGVLIAMKTDPKDSPFGVIANLVRFSYHPFTYLGADLLRFILLSLLATLSFFLPVYHLYPIIALFFFGKYFGQLACTVFLCDPRISAFVGMVLVYIPLLMIGSLLLLSIWIKSKGARLYCGSDFCRRTLPNAVILFIKTALFYLSALVLIHVVLCGIFYLVVIAL